MPHNVTLSLESVPTTSQSTPQYRVVLAAAGFAFTLTTMQTTQSVLPWHEKLTAPLERPTSHSITLIAHAPLQAKPKKSWLSTATKRIREKIPVEAWDNFPDISAVEVLIEIIG